MPKRTGNSSVNSSIRQNTVTTGEGFTQLLQLQQLSNEQLQSINIALSVSLLDAMKDIAKNLKQSSPTINSNSVVNNSNSSTAEVIKSKEDKTKGDALVNNSNSSTAEVIKSKEDKTEGDALVNKQIALLEKIEHNLSGAKATGKGNAVASNDFGLGGFASAIAVALGAIVGAFRAQLKTIKYFIEMLTPEKMILNIRKSIASISTALSMQFDLVKSAISEKISGIAKVFDTAIDSIKSVFTIGEESKIGKFIKSVSSGLSSLFGPFIEAFTVVKDFMTGTASKAFTAIKNIFSTIGTKFSSFVGLFKGAAAIFEKLFFPLTIIMTVWDTVKGAMEGFEKDGIIGGISGAVKGFFNSLILGPADMLKDAIAWLAGVFGFDNAKKQLESFSFEKMFSDLIDTLFTGPKAVIDWISDMFNKLKSLEIPKFGFTIPIINKEVSVGPFKPFASLGGNGATQSNDTTGGTTSSAAPNIAPSPIQSGVAPSQAVTQSSSEVSAMKENQSSNITSSVVSPTVNNNVKQTQIAKIDAPVRSNDSSVDNYFSSRARFI